MSVADSFEGTSPLISDRFITREIASGAITMGQLVQQTTTGQTVIVTANAPSNTRCGIALTTAASGKAVSVLWRGRVRATAYGTITAGDWVGPASGGSAAGCIQTITLPSSSAGSALTNAIAQALNVVGSCEIGAASGASAVILMD